MIQLSDRDALALVRRRAQEAHDRRRTFFFVTRHERRLLEALVAPYDLTVEQWCCMEVLVVDYELPVDERMSYARPAWLVAIVGERK